MKKPSKREAPLRKAGKPVRAAAAPAVRRTEKKAAVRPQAKSPAARGSARGAPVLAAPSQTDVFAQAARAFHAGRFAEAKSLYEAATTGANREMAHSARLHMRMCEQRLAKEIPVLATAEEHYNYAVALMNRREFQSARKYLEQALRLSGDGDHLHYALALCLGTLGDLDGACQHLKRAIEIHPRNRAIARNDPDFAELVHRSPISELLHSAGQGRS